MANLGLVQSYLSSVPATQRPALLQAFLEVLQNFTAGRPEPGVTQIERACNLRWYPVSFVTSSVANREVAIPHGLPTAPYLVIPVLDPTEVGGQLVPLKVTRIADNEFVYLSSSVTNATVTIFVEG